MSRIRIPPQGLEALRALSALEASKFNRLAAEIASLHRPSIRASALYHVVRENVQNDAIAKAFSSLFISLALFVRAEKLDSQEVIKGLRLALSQADGSADFPEGRKNLIEWFSEAELGIEAALSSESVILSAKALDLSVDFDCLYTSANVVTDVRPVFDDEKTKICGAIVAQTLRLHYVPDGPASGEKEISLALDYDDIVKLIEELQNAKTKAQTIKEHFRDGGALEIFSVGEETYGFEG